jgi:hypothetical protein
MIDDHHFFSLHWSEHASKYKERSLVLLLVLVMSDVINYYISV